MADILQKIKDWDFTSKDSSVTINLDYSELAEVSDIVDRKLWLTDEIEGYTANNLIYSILRYNVQDKNVKIENRKPIMLYINSVGGSTIDGLGLISAIKTSKTPIYTIVLGNAASMALIVSIVGHKRYCMPNAVYLMHEGFTGDVDSTSKMRERTLFITGTMEDRIKEIILSHTTLTKKMYGEKYKEEWYFFPEIAKKYGFTDYIIGQDCDIDEII